MNQSQREFGDFQTPDSLAIQCTAVLKRRFYSRRRPSPSCVVEPTCGEGRFLAAAVDCFDPDQAFGFEINPDYAKQARRRLSGRATIRRANFFQKDWCKWFAGLPEETLVIGNPPWVTNSEQGAIGAENLPAKMNLHQSNGIDAITGKSNFDISESMLIQLLDALSDRPATIAMLCKTAVARKVLLHRWKNGGGISRAAVIRIDAKREFSASVDACFFVAQLGGKETTTCDVFDSLETDQASSKFGLVDEALVANVDAFHQTRHLRAAESDRERPWRSGVKHDCAKVMELKENDGVFYNGLGEVVNVESDVLFPLLKSSDVAGGRTKRPTRWILMTQRTVGEDTSRLQTQAPKAWAYLSDHATLLQRRKSAIYRGRPPFSIFGVGPYTFSRAKVAVSSLYKQITFTPVGTFRGKPIVLDDTCYSLACTSQREATGISQALNSPLAEEFLSALVFSDAKRPITCGILQQLDIDKLCNAMCVAP
ncbi:MAG: hypothetical protein AB8B91_25875 [Rubripirellula sp.]